MDLRAIEYQIEYLNKLKQIQSKKPGNEIEAIFLKYIEVKRTSEVADHMNALGIKIQSKRGYRKWISTDVTKILDDPASADQVDDEIYQLVKRMQKSRRLNSKLFESGRVV